MMGVYLYTLRKSNPRNTPLGPVYRYEYKDRLAKSGYFHWETGVYVDCEEIQEKYVERYEDRFDYLNDCLVCIAGHEGGTVYRQKQSVPIWWDCNGVLGMPVGVLRKRKNRWYIATIQEEMDEAMGLLISYAHKNQFVLPINFSDALTKCYRHFQQANLTEGWVHINADNKDDHEKLGEAHRVERLRKEIKDLSNTSN